MHLDFCFLVTRLCPRLETSASQYISIEMVHDAIEGFGRHEGLWAYPFQVLGDIVMPRPSNVLPHFVVDGSNLQSDPSSSEVIFAYTCGFSCIPHKDAAVVLSG